MLRLRQFRYGQDNLSYILFTSQQAIAIDPGAVESIYTFLFQQKLSLIYILNTHSHEDHTCGNRELGRLTGAPAKPISAGTLSVGKEVISAFSTPGHTLDSVCYHHESMLISGDTLFNGTIGNCFSGDYRAFFKTVRFLMALPDETDVYAGHDYVHASIAFARHLEGHNPALNEIQNQYDPNCVKTTIAQERAINPYFRFNEPTIIDVLKQHQLPVTTEWERWYSLMQLE